MIRKAKSGAKPYKVYSHTTGKLLGSYSTRKGAEKDLVRRKIFKKKK